MSDRNFRTKDGNVTFRRNKGTHWVACIDENYAHSYGFPTPNF